MAGLTEQTHGTACPSLRASVLSALQKPSARPISRVPWRVLCCKTACVPPRTCHPPKPSSGSAPSGKLSRRQEPTGISPVWLSAGLATGTTVCCSNTEGRNLYFRRNHIILRETGPHEQDTALRSGLSWTLCTDPASEAAEQGKGRVRATRWGLR